MSGIFISYRREDTAGWVGRLTEHLHKRYPAEKVFQDIASIAPGEDFVAAIEHALSASRIVLVVIGPAWLHCSAGERRRLDDPKDYVRLEVGQALQQPRLKVIPVLVGGAPMPRPDELPQDLQGLVRLNAIELSDTRWAYDVDRLCRRIAKLLPPKRLERRALFAAAGITIAGLICYYVLSRPTQKGNGTGVIIADAPPFPVTPNRPAWPPAPPPSPVPDPAANFQPGQTFNDCAECPEMVILPPGEFKMGSLSKEEGHETDESPLHTVKIGYRFAVGKFEITRGQFAAFVKATDHDPSASCWSFDATKFFKLGWEDPDLQQDDTHPVVCVNRWNAQAYTEWLSQKTGRSYRLLSESEWEYAVRAGTTTPFYWAATFAEAKVTACAHENLLDKTFVEKHRHMTKRNWREVDVVNCADGYAYTAPVGRYSPNAFGLYDMGGNVSEWVLDCPDYEITYEGYADAHTDGSPVLTSTDCRVAIFRGGRWWGESTNSRSADRASMNSAKTDPFIGFRVARDL